MSLARLQLFYADSRSRLQLFHADVRSRLRSAAARLAWRAETDKLARPDLAQIPAITSFYNEVAEYARCVGLPPYTKLAHLPALPKEWMQMRNAAVLITLRADRRLVGYWSQDVENGIYLLKDAERRTKDLLERRRGLKHARHLRGYYLTVLALLQVRLAKAYARLGVLYESEDSATKAKIAFDTAKRYFADARRLQPGMGYVVQELARFLARRGELEQAENALRGTGSVLTWSARTSKALREVEIAREAIAGARAADKLRDMLPWLERTESALDDTMREHGNDLTKEMRTNVTMTKAVATTWRGMVLSELKDFERAVLAFSEIGDAFFKDAKWASSALSVAIRLGDAQAQSNQLTQAAESYHDALNKWKALRQATPDVQTAELVKMLAARQALAAMLISDGDHLDEYAQQFATHRPGPFAFLLDVTESLLSRPGAKLRLRLALERRLQAAPTAASALDLTSALSRLVVAGAADWETIPTGLDERGPSSIVEPIRMELQDALLESMGTRNLFQQARERIKKKWGVEFPRIRGARGAPEGEYRLFLRGKLAGGGKLVQAEASPEVPSSIRSRILDLMPIRPRSPPAEDPRIAQIVAAVEACIDQNIWRVFGFAGLRRLMTSNGILSDDRTAAPAEVERMASMRPLLLFVRDLLVQRIPLVDFGEFFSLWRERRAAGDPPDRIVEAVRQRREITDTLWTRALSRADPPGSVLSASDVEAQPKPPLFRLTKAGAAQLGPALTATDRAARAWGRRTLQALTGSIGPNGILILPDKSFRSAIQRLLPDIPVFAADEVPPGNLGLASVLDDPGSPPVAPRPAAPTEAQAAEHLDRVIGQEAARRGLAQEAVAGVSRHAHAAARRGEDPHYAMELALDQFGPDHIDLRARAPIFAELENWVAGEAATDALRHVVFRSSGIWAPRFRINLDDDLEANAWTIGFNRLSKRIPHASSPSDLTDSIFVFLTAHLGAFVGNRQVEFLLFQLNACDEVLLSNLLERYRVGAIVKILRELVVAGRSVRDLQGIAEELVLNETDVTALDPVVRAELLSEVAPAIGL